MPGVVTEFPTSGHMAVMADTWTADGPVAFVLGGGGLLGAAEVGMLEALVAAGVRADIVVGTSVGAINGAAYAADPTAAGVERLAGLWRDLDRFGVFSESLLARIGNLMRSGTYLHRNEPLADALAAHLAAETFADLAVPFSCVAACIESAREHWFESGPLVPAVLASCAVPGLLPAVGIGDVHYVDGGVVNSVPVGRALAAGAHTVFVLHVGRLERPLEPPRNPWEVGLVVFELARRHRFFTDLAAVPDGVAVHVLPSGAEVPRFSDLANLRYRDTRRIGTAATQARQATAEYLDAHLSGVA